MQRTLLKSKIHQAVVTEANLYYKGSLTIDKNLMEAADILEFERVEVVNINNGERFDTYAIEGERGSGEMCLNGAAARKGTVGDQIIVFTYAILNEDEVKTHRPKILLLNNKNEIEKELTK